MPSMGLLYDPELENLSAETIYDMLMENLRKSRKLSTFRGYGKGDMMEPQSDRTASNADYTTFDEIKDLKFDGMIITGAPVEQMPFEEVDYWEEICKVMEWTKKNVTSTLHICWGAQAALYYHYGIDKKLLPEKMFGIYPFRVLNRKVPLVRGFDDVFLAPNSRHTTVAKEDIVACPALKILAESDEVGVLLAIAEEGRQIFVMGHPEYDRMTLDNEYKRDLGKGLPIAVPRNYYPGDDPTQRPLLQWRAHSNNLYSNWLNYYVYQVTPYEL